MKDNLNSPKHLDFYIRMFYEYSSEHIFDTYLRKFLILFLEIFIALDIIIKREQKKEILYKLLSLDVNDYNKIFDEIEQEIYS